MYYDVFRETTNEIHNATKEKVAELLKLIFSLKNVANVL